MAGTLSPRRGDARPETQPGATVGGRYHLEGVLGAGAMGTVYAARHTVIDRVVALKVVAAPLLRDAALAHLLLDEARAAARVTHPNLVQVLDAGVDDLTGDLFLVMEHLDAETLRALLDRRGALPVAEAVSIVAPLLEALDAVHAAGTVHRDVKPENILVARTAAGELRPVLIDFGIARVLARDPVRDATLEAAVLGTPAYMPPEQRRAPAHVDARADLWSVAVVLHEAVTGVAPRADAPPDLASAPAPLAPVLARALSDDPARRPATARALRDALLAAASPATTPRPAPRRALVAALALALVALVGGVALRASPPRTAATARAARAAPPRDLAPPAPPRAAPPTTPPPSTSPLARATSPSPAPRAQAPAPTPRAVVRRATRPPSVAAQPPPAASPRAWFEPREGTLRQP